MIKYLKPMLSIILSVLFLGFTGCQNANNSGHIEEKNREHIADTEAKTRSKEQEEASKTLLDVPIIAQKPELDNGCEITSLATLLQYAEVCRGYNR